jgi:hypothetical protein
LYHYACNSPFIFTRARTIYTAILAAARFGRARRGPVRPPRPFLPRAQERVVTRVHYSKCSGLCQPTPAKPDEPEVVRHRHVCCIFGYKVCFLQISLAACTNTESAWGSFADGGSFTRVCFLANLGITLTIYSFCYQALLDVLGRHAPHSEALCLIAELNPKVVIRIHVSETLPET